MIKKLFSTRLTVIEILFLLLLHSLMLSTDLIDSLSGLNKVNNASLRPTDSTLNNILPGKSSIKAAIFANGFLSL